MADDATPGPPQPKKLGIRNPKQLVEDELLAFANFNDSEDEPFLHSEGEWSGVDDISEDEGECDVQPILSESDLEEEEIMPQNNNLDWVENPPDLKKIPFLGNPGVLADDDLLNLLVRETNAYAETVLLNGPNPRPHSRISRWKPVDKEEMKVFLGIMFYMGIVQLPRMRDYWRTDRLYNHKRNFMSRNRYFILLRCLHFVHNLNEGDPQPSDRLYSASIK
ncbi:hypothetical protein NQ318_017367 [Aromia moschata]|uniref:PiggyBac transposable element-derived protein domain-containing protein n=1 Tax=Aromia moschata TaxID=1265417 RepID=A0AAV8Z2V6_9CUCU|nr:hypothetical protein NQ318_017367 [Aromia moschata]